MTPVEMCEKIISECNRELDSNSLDPYESGILVGRLEAAYVILDALKLEILKK